MTLSSNSGKVAPGDRFQQVMPYGNDRLEVESWIDGERVAVRRRSGGRQVFPVATLLNPAWWVRLTSAMGAGRSCMSCGGNDGYGPPPHHDPDCYFASHEDSAVAHDEEEQS